MRDWKAVGGRGSTYALNGGLDSIGLFFVLCKLLNLWSDLKFLGQTNAAEDGVQA